METRYITSQRRPAIIPSDAQLTSEDEQSIRLRTGHAALQAKLLPPSPPRLPSAHPHKSVSFTGDFSSSRKSSDSSSKAKRKASTTGEAYYEADAAVSNVETRVNSGERRISWDLACMGSLSVSLTNTKLQTHCESEEEDQIDPHSCETAYAGVNAEKRDIDLPPVRHYSTASSCESSAPSVTK